MQATREPGLQALGKVPYGLCESPRDWAQHLRHQEIHNALVEDIVAEIKVVHHWLAASQQKQLVSGKLLVRFIINRDIIFPKIR